MPLNLPPTLSLFLVGTIMVKLTSMTVHSIDIDPYGSLFSFWRFHSPISYLNLASRSPYLKFDHKPTTHLILYLMSEVRLLSVLVGSNTKLYKSMLRTYL